MSYDGYNGFWRFLPVFDMFEDEIGNVRIIIENELSTKFWGSWKPYFCLVALKRFLVTMSLTRQVAEGERGVQAHQYTQVTGTQ